METFLVPGILSSDPGGGRLSHPESMLSPEPAAARMEMAANGASPSVTLDFGRKTTGYLRFEVAESGSGGILLEYGPIPGLFAGRRTVRIPEAGATWTDELYVACRFLRLSLVPDPDGSAPFLSLRRLGLVFSAYPCETRGAFHSGDDALDRIWSTGAYTVQLCLQRSSQASDYIFANLPETHRRFIRDWRSRYSPYVIFDGPRRDRETWLGDIRTEALAIYGSFGADEVVKSSLEMFLDLQRPDGTTVGCGSTWQEFKEYNLWWIVAIWECYLYTGDEAFLLQFVPGLRRLVDWIQESLDGRGFMPNDGNWMWTLPREGHSSATQCILVESLRCAARIERAAGAPDRAEVLERQADRTRESIRRTYWSEEKGVFEDSLKLVDAEIPVMSDVNCYAVSFGIADDRQVPRILAYLRERMWTPYGSATLDRRIETAHISPEAKQYPLLPFVRSHPHPEKRIVEFMYPHNRMIWPFVNGYEVEARFIAGDTDGAFELVRRCWGNLLDGDAATGTFWECVDADTGTFPTRSFFPGAAHDCFNSAAHGWSGWISWILQAYVLGVRPLEPAFRKVAVSPDPGPLPEVSGSVPTPKGPVHVRVTSGAEELRVEVDAPDGVEPVVDVRPSVLAGRRLVVRR